MVWPSTLFLLSHSLYLITINIIIIVAILLLCSKREHSDSQQSYYMYIMVCVCVCMQTPDKNHWSVKHLKRPLSTDAPHDKKKHQANDRIRVKETENIHINGIKEMRQHNQCLRIHYAPCMGSLFFPLVLTVYSCSLASFCFVFVHRLPSHLCIYPSLMKTHARIWRALINNLHRNQARVWVRQNNTHTIDFVACNGQWQSASFYVRSLARSLARSLLLFRRRVYACILNALSLSNCFFFAVSFEYFTLSFFSFWLHFLALFAAHHIHAFNIFSISLSLFVFCI